MSEYIGHNPRINSPYEHDRGEWYVSRERDVFGGDDIDFHEYLHRDGVWRTSTRSAGWDGGWTGYFESEDEAKAALAKARGECIG